jgi:hypothetical protein
MRVIRRPALQAHAVPATAAPPRGPFSAELLAPPVIDRTVPNDNPFPPGATAQNDFRGARMYQCKACKEVVPEYGIDAHICGEHDGED